KSLDTFAVSNVTTLNPGLPIEIAFVRLIKAIASSINENNPHSLPGKTSRNSQANATSGTSDESSTIAELFHECVSGQILMTMPPHTLIPPVHSCGSRAGGRRDHPSRCG